METSGNDMGYDLEEQTGCPIEIEDLYNDHSHEGMRAVI